MTVKSLFTGIPLAVLAIQFLAINVLRAEAVCQDGLVAYWDFEKADDYVTDNPQDAVAPRLSDDVPPGFKSKNGHSLSFDGVDDVVTIPDDDRFSFTSPQAQITFSNWVKLNKGYDTTDYFGKYDNAAQQGEYVIRIFPSGEMDIAIVDAGRSHRRAAWRTTGAGITAGKWHHIAVTIDITAKKIAFYLNGQEIPSALVEGDIFPNALGNRNAPLRFGAIRCSKGDLCGYLNGKLDDVRIYSRLLDQQEIKQLSLGKEIPCPTPSK